jgi:hypothetical protein
MEAVARLLSLTRGNQACLRGFQANSQSNSCTSPSISSSYSSDLAMEQPTIRVEDTDNTAPLTLHYTLGSNSLDTVAIAASIHGLLTHPGRACIEPDTAEVPPCSDAFFIALWSAAASLLDYFADFYAIDTPLMQSVWFHLLDIWQTASPAALYEQDSNFRYSSEAQTFKSDYNETLALFQRLVGHPQGETAWRGRADEKHTEALIHHPNGRVDAEAGAYETGPFLSGLKPWQQFLCAGAPGFLPTRTSPGEQSTQDQHTRYIPQPAIALMQAHTARARALVAQLAQKQNLQSELAQSSPPSTPPPSLSPPPRTARTQPTRCSRETTHSRTSCTHTPSSRARRPCAGTKGSATRAGLSSSRMSCAWTRRWGVAGGPRRMCR